MATNITEKDKTLNEIIDWAKSRCHEAGLSRFDVRRKSDRDFYDGQVNAFHEMLELCRSRLGYSGSMPSYLNYEDIDDSSPDMHPQVGDYGVAIRENSHGQEEIPFHIEREEHTGLPVALLNMQRYAKPEDDIDHGQYVSLFQLYLDGFMLSRTGRNAAQNQSEDAK